MTYEQYEQQERERQKQHKSAIVKRIPEWKKLGFVTVIAHYSGSGDEGSLQDIRGYTADDGQPEPKTADSLYESDGTALTEANDVQLAFESLAPSGYENNEGGFGFVVVDIAKETVTLHSHYNVESSQYQGATKI